MSKRSENSQPDGGDNNTSTYGKWMGVLVGLVIIVIVAFATLGAKKAEAEAADPSPMEPELVEEVLEMADEMHSDEASEIVPIEDPSWFQFGKRWEKYIRESAEEIEGLEMQDLSAQRAEVLAERTKLDELRASLEAEAQANDALTAQFEDRARLLQEEEQALQSRLVKLTSCIAKAMEESDG